MHLAALSTLDTYPELDEAGAAARCERALRLVPVAERLGYRSFWVTEHHFQPGGVLPCPPVWLAAAGQRTRRIRLGVMVAVLPLHHPWELAEQYALADRLVGGRLEIGVGCGYVAEEFRGFGRPVADRRVALDRDLPRFLDALRGEPLLPDRDHAPIRLNVRPLQRPYPPVWRAVAGLERIRAVGRDGGRIAMVPYASARNLDEVGRQVGAYREALPAGQPARALAALHVFVGDELELAEVALQRFLDTHAPPVDSARGVVGPGTARRDVRQLCEAGLALIGSESTIRSQLRDLVATGITDLAGMFDFGGLPESLVVRSMRRWRKLVRSELAGRSTAVSPSAPAEPIPDPSFGGTSGPAPADAPSATGIASTDG